MKTAVNFKREIDGDVDSAIERVTFALKPRALELYRANEKWMFLGVAANEKRHEQSLCNLRLQPCQLF